METTININKRPFKRGADLFLIASMLLAAFLNMYLIWTDKYVNTYYTTAVASMMMNFHNFFYGTLDSGGFVTVDKPPLTFMIQTVFAFIFGLHGWSVILPQALAGVGSVLLIYLLVKPGFGTGAARAGALVMACTPVAVAVSRTNNIDSMLVFALLLAVWFLFKGVKRGKRWAVITGFGLIGIGFNIKMLEAYMVLPAFYFFYLLAGKGGWKHKAVTLLASTLVCAVISLSWAVIVDATPEDQRPYIGSSQTNSVLNLAFGYNGVSRLTGDRNPGGGVAGGSGGGNAGVFRDVSPGSGDFNGAGRDGRRSFSGTNGEAGNPGFGGERPTMSFGGGGGMFDTGTKGPLRLFQSELSGQASWMLPFVLFGLIALFAGFKVRQMSWKHKEALFWLAWLVPVMGFFSMAGFFHQYYLIMMAPPIAALTGAGWTEMTRAWREKEGWKAWLLPAAVLLTAAFSWYIVHPYDSEIGQGWSIAILVTGALATVWLAAGILKPSLGKSAAVLGFLILLIGPMYWAFTPILYGQSSMTPAAGPSLTGGGFGGDFGAGRSGSSFPVNMPGGGWNSGNGENRSQAGGQPGGADGLGGSRAADGGSSGIEDDAANAADTSNGANAQKGTGTANPVGAANPAGTADGANPDAGNAGAWPGAAFPADRRSSGTAASLQWGAGRGGSGPGESSSLNEGLYQYLKDNNTGEKYLFAATDYSTLAPFIIEKGETVISLGGFSGSDPVLSVDRLQELIAAGKLKFIYLSGGRGGNSTLSQWIQDHGTEIPSSEWQGTTGGNTDIAGGRGFGGGGTLYEFTPEQGE